MSRIAALLLTAAIVTPCSALIWIAAHTKHPGMLVCFVGEKVSHAFEGSDITYLGKGEWRMVSKDGTGETVFVKGELTDCIVDPR